MANPFSGLENIGASYMAGARLAQERQRRADEIAARQEEARIRQQYYQDIIAERQAAREALAGEREAQGATLFGKYLVRKADGTIDYQASQAAKQAGEEQGRLGAAYGALVARGESPGPISPQIMQTPEFMAARAAGIDRRAAEAKATRDTMARLGFIPRPAEPAFGFTPELLRAPRDASMDVTIEDQTFEPSPVTRAKMMKAEKPADLGKEKIELPGGIIVERPITPERSAAIAAQLASAEPNELDQVSEAEKQLRDLQITSDETEFNLVRGEGGKLSVVPDTIGSIGLSASQILADLDLERKKREQRKRLLDKGESLVPVTPAGKPGLPQRVPVNQQVIDVRSIQGLRPLPSR